MPPKTALPVWPSWATEILQWHPECKPSTVTKLNIPAGFIESLGPVVRIEAPKDGALTSAIIGDGPAISAISGLYIPKDEAIARDVPRKVRVARRAAAAVEDDGDIRVIAARVINQERNAAGEQPIQAIRRPEPQPARAAAALPAQLPAAAPARRAAAAPRAVINVVENISSHLSADAQTFWRKIAELGDVIARDTVDRVINSLAGEDRRIFGEQYIHAYKTMERAIDHDQFLIIEERRGVNKSALISFAISRGWAVYDNLLNDMEQLAVIADAGEYIGIHDSIAADIRGG